MRLSSNHEFNTQHLRHSHGLCRENSGSHGNGETSVFLATYPASQHRAPDVNWHQDEAGMPRVLRIPSVVTIPFVSSFRVTAGKDLCRTSRPSETAGPTRIATYGCDAWDSRLPVRVNHSRTALPSNNSDAALISWRLLPRASVERVNPARPEFFKGISCRSCRQSPTIPICDVFPGG